MPNKQPAAPDSIAVRTALWRAMHVQVDPPPRILEDEIGLKLAAPDEGWRNRQDMHPQWTRGFRAAIVARARFVKDLIAEQAGRRVRPRDAIDDRADTRGPRTIFSLP